MHVVVCTAPKKKRLDKKTVSRISGDYDEIQDTYDNIAPYSELPNEEDQVKATSATKYKPSRPNVKDA
jgi:hypothetical protein